MIDKINKNYGYIIEEAHKKYPHISSKMIGLIIGLESSGNKHANSGKAMGLTQLTPSTARDLGVHNIYDPKENIMGGTKYLNQLNTRYHGDTDKMLAAYNAGSSRVDSGKTLPKETRDYIARYHNMENK